MTRRASAKPKKQETPKDADDGTWPTVKVMPTDSDEACSKCGGPLAGLHVRVSPSGRYKLDGRCYWARTQSTA